MHFFNSLVPGFLLLASTTISRGQATAMPATDPAVPAELSTRRVLVKVGLNAARAFRYGDYYGLAARVPLTVGGEYLLSSKFALYGQLDADLGVPNSNYYYEHNPVVPTSALSLGARYYYNQAGRARHQRAHGPFIGNYLAVEGHTEMQRYAVYSAISQGSDKTMHSEYVPSLNLLWGMQRRLSRSLLFDFNAGIGLGSKRSDAHFGGFSAGALNLSSQINLGIYFGR